MTRDTYGFTVRPGMRRIQGCACKMRCQRSYKCTGCGQWRPWCCGGAPDPRCDHCVAKCAEKETGREMTPAERQSRKDSLPMRRFDK